jgi:hypothetical protein
MSDGRDHGGGGLAISLAKSLQGATLLQPHFNQRYSNLSVKLKDSIPVSLVKIDVYLKHLFICCLLWHPYAAMSPLPTKTLHNDERR